MKTQNYLMQERRLPRNEQVSMNVENQHFVKLFKDPFFSKGNCLDNVIDGSFMGIILGVCLITILVTTFFAFKHLYFAVVKKVYPEKDEF